MGENHSISYDGVLAGCAMSSASSRGRVYPEAEHAYRTPFQRDRDRIIHSAAFRRLEGKTQVFLIHRGDYYRNRLTHTIEVSQISRTIARALRLNEDLTEAIALAHDLGHPPFGHAGEAALHEIMKDHGGFEHNRQGLRVVDMLETRYPDFPGLNLTHEVREGILKHGPDAGFAGDPSDPIQPGAAPALEARVVNIADEITYSCHDVDDGLKSGIISEDELFEAELPASVLRGLDAPAFGSNAVLKRYALIRSLINIQVNDLLEQSRANISALNLDSLEKVRRTREPVIAFSPEMEIKNEQLKTFLRERFYHCPQVSNQTELAGRIVSAVFSAYSKNALVLPDADARLKRNDSVTRAVCDYIAGMTDRFAISEYEKLFGTI